MPDSSGAVLPAIFSTIQFPWRFYAFAAMFLAIAIGVMLDVLCVQPFRKFGLALLVLFMCGSAVITLTHSIKGYVDINSDYLNNENASYLIGNGEYLPIGVDRSEIRLNPAVVTADNGKTVNFSKNGIKTTFPANSARSYYDVPLIFYKGYTAVFTDSAGNSTKLALDGAGANKTIRVYCSGFSGSGTITVNYTGTLVQKLSALVSLISAVLLGVVGIQKNRRKKLLSQPETI